MMLKCTTFYKDATATTTTNKKNGYIFVHFRLQRHILYEWDDVNLRYLHSFFCFVNFLIVFMCHVCVCVYVALNIEQKTMFLWVFFLEVVNDFGICSKVLGRLPAFFCSFPCSFNEIIYLRTRTNKWFHCIYTPLKVTRMRQHIL